MKPLTSKFLRILSCLCVFSSSLWAQLGDITSIALSGNTLTIGAGPDIVVFRVCAEKIIMVDYQPNGAVDPDTLVLANTTWNAVSAAIDTASDPITITTTGFKFCVSKHPMRISGYDSTGMLLFNEPANSGFYPFGLELDVKTGDFYGIKNRKNGGLISGTGDQILAGSQGGAAAPFVWTTNGWGMIIDTEGDRITISTSRISYQHPYPPHKRDIKIHFVFGTPREIFKGLADVSGHAPLFPKFSFGFLNTEWGIDQTELFTDVSGYRTLNIPLDAYILDFDWMAWGEDNYGEFRWGPKFPSAPSGELKSMLNAVGCKLMGIRKPRVHLGTVQGNYAESKSFFHHYETDYFSGKQVGVLNFHNAGVRKWYWESFGILNDSYNKGIIGYWNDEADTYGGNNMFLQMQRANYEGQRSFNNERVWSINRNFFLGAQRYAYGHWSGDIGSGFYEMARQRLFMLSSVVLGSAWWGMDIGGFSQSPTPENYYRWIQFGAFVPIFRVHGSLNAEREPWRYGAEAESIATRYIRLRYRLMPYIYSAAWKNHVSGTPIVRPLVMDYPRDHSVSDQYDEWMFGDDILVAPVVYQGATSQQIYLPEGDWIDFHTGMKYDGPTYFQHAVTKQDIPIFVKAGAVIPMAPVGNFVDDSIARSALIFSCYPGGNSSTVVYEDDGMTYDYEKGTYRLITATHSSAAGKRMLSMERRTGALLVPPRSFVVEFNGIGATPDSVLIDSTLMVKQVLDSIRNGNSSGWAYDAIAKQCLVRFQEDGLPHAVTAFYNPGIEGALDHDVNHPAESLRLFDNYPNPFNASTTISYTILTVSNISMVALNVLGQVVEQIESGEREAGHHAFKWNTELPSGVYFIRIESFPVGAPGVCSRELKRMMILR